MFKTSDMKDTCKYIGLLAVTIAFYPITMALSVLAYVYMFMIGYRDVKDITLVIILITTGLYLTGGAYKWK